MLKFKRTDVVDRRIRLSRIPRICQRRFAIVAFDLLDETVLGELLSHEALVVGAPADVRGATILVHVATANTIVFGPGVKFHLFVNED